MIVDIKTSIYATDERVTNVQHDVTMSYIAPDHTTVTKQKTFINQLDDMVTFILTNKEVEELPE